MIVFILLALACCTANAQQSSAATSNPHGSLGDLIWTNFIAHTNGRTMDIWSVYKLPTNFPVGWVEPRKLPRHTTPRLAWNTNCLMWGMKGETAISQCWTAQGYRGQVPVTALTRRHGYTRGHDCGPAGLHSTRDGHRVYFCTTNNRVIEAVVKNMYVEIGRGYDFTLLIFSKDLPPEIEPMRVADTKMTFEQYAPGPAGHWISFMTEQSGHVSANCPPFILNTMKGGDSGSPNMLPMPGELIFYSGRTTSGPSKQMQDDMDELSRSIGLDPAKYQLQWFDLSVFPKS